MAKIEMPPSRHLVAVDQHYIQFRKATGGARNAVEGIYHQHQNAEFPLHDLNQARSRNFAQLELGSETLACFHCIFEASCKPQ